MGDQIEVLSIGTGNTSCKISKFAVRGGFFQWKEIIKGAMFLTTDNAQAQATLLLGPENILPLSRRATPRRSIWTTTAAPLMSSSRSPSADFAANRAQIELFFREKGAPRHQFYTDPITTHDEWRPGPASGGA